MKRILLALALLTAAGVALASDNLTVNAGFHQIAVLVNTESIDGPAVQDNTEAVHTTVNRAGNYIEFVGELKLLEIMIESGSYLGLSVDADYDYDAEWEFTGYVFTRGAKVYHLPYAHVSGFNYEHVAVEVTLHLQ